MHSSEHTQELRRHHAGREERRDSGLTASYSSYTKANRKDMHWQGHASADVRAIKGTVGYS